MHCRMYNADLFIEVLFHIFCDIRELLFDLTDISALFCDSIKCSENLCLNVINIILKS